MKPRGKQGKKKGRKGASQIAKAYNAAGVKGKARGQIGKTNAALARTKGKGKK